MSLFTGKGDSGTTSTFGCDQRISKSSAVAEALGSLDEVNSYLGFCRYYSGQTVFKLKFKGEKVHASDLIIEIQKNLFIIQAEVAGADKTIEKEKVERMSNIINEVEKEMPPIKTFFISGGLEISTYFDFARTLARRAERRVVAVHEEGLQKVGEGTLAYLNRLSSFLYAMARYSNHKYGAVEIAPDYE